MKSIHPKTCFYLGLLLTFGLIHHSRGENNLANASFEAGLSGWTIDYGDPRAVSNLGTTDGTNACLMGNSGLTQTFTTVRGRLYLLSFSFAGYGTNRALAGVTYNVWSDVTPFGRDLVSDYRLSPPTIPARYETIQRAFIADHTQTYFKIQYNSSHEAVNVLLDNFIIRDISTFKGELKDKTPVLTWRSNNVQRLEESTNLTSWTAVTNQPQISGINYSFPLTNYISTINMFYRLKLNPRPTP